MGCPSSLTMPLIADSDCDGQHTFVLGVQPLRRSVKEGNPHRENRAAGAVLPTLPARRLRFMGPEASPPVQIERGYALRMTRSRIAAASVGFPPPSKPPKRSSGRRRSTDLSEINRVLQN